MIRPIIFKSLRSIWKNKKSYFSGILVLSIGLGVFIGMISTLITYDKTFNRYYADTNLADVSAHVVAMPRSSIIDLTRIDGVAQTLGVLEYSVDAHIYSIDDVLSVRLVGLDDGRAINVYEYFGEPIDSDNDIWLGRTFFELHHLNIGDTIRLFINGSYEKFNIRGSVISPEHLINMPEGGTFADENLSTIGFVRNSVVESIADMPGMVNNISIILDEGSSFEDIHPFLEDVLERYGIQSIIGRADFPSYRITENESNTVRIIATLIPVLFISIACAMLYVTLKRLVELERTEIGTLKAMGFSNNFILGGYLFQGVLASIIGFIMAVAFSYIVGNLYYNMIMSFYRFEAMDYALDIQTSVYGFFIALVVSLFAVIMGAKEAISVKPAEAMRAAHPQMGSSNINLDNLLIRLFFDAGGIFAIRSMLRNSKRTLTTVASIAMAFALINSLYSANSHIRELSDRRFTKIEVSDATVVLKDFVSRSTVLSDIARITGVVKAEANLAVPVVLEHEGIRKELTIYGLDKYATLFNIIDNRGNRYQPDSGIILNHFYAEEIGVKEGDTVILYSPHINESIHAEVSRVIEESFGVGAYMDISELSMLFGSEIVSNTVLVDVEEGFLSETQSELAAASNVLMFNDNSRGLAFQRASIQIALGILNIIIAVSVVICFIIVYNTSSISLGEKQREYATLRILGYHTSDVSEINTLEYVLMLLAGSIVGTVIAYFISPPLSALFNNESAAYNAEITLRSTMLSFASCAVAVGVSCILIRSQIKRFNLANVLKERE